MSNGLLVINAQIEPVFRRQRLYFLVNPSHSTGFLNPPVELEPGAFGILRHLLLEAVHAAHRIVVDVETLGDLVADWRRHSDQGPRSVPRSRSVVDGAVNLLSAAVRYAEFA